MKEIIIESGKGTVSSISLRLINNIIKYNLYKLDMDVLISWFLGSFQLFDAFK